MDFFSALNPMFFLLAVIGVGVGILFGAIPCMTATMAVAVCLPLIYALDLQLERIFEEGLEARFARHSAMAERVQSWALDRGLDLFAPEGYRSQTVTTVRNLLEINVGALNAFLGERQMRIANGYGSLKGKTFRIGHMGETRLEDVDALLAAMDEFLG